MAEIRKSKDSEEEPGESDRKRKRESDKQEIQEGSGKTKKRKELERYLNLQQYNKDSKEKLGESDKERKQESDRKKEDSVDSSIKKSSSDFKRFIRLQQHDAERKALSSQSQLENASGELKPNEPLGDIPNLPKSYSESDLKPKEVKENIHLNKGQKNIDPIKMGYQRKILQERGPSVDLPFDLLMDRREIPKPPPRLDTNPNKSQD